jgi:hypothetical protein
VNGPSRQQVVGVVIVLGLLVLLTLYRLWPLL